MLNSAKQNGSQQDRRFVRDSGVLKIGRRRKLQAFYEPKSRPKRLGKPDVFAQLFGKKLKKSGSQFSFLVNAFALSYVI